jgi:hypothetical protein
MGISMNQPTFENTSPPNYWRGTRRRIAENDQLAGELAGTEATEDGTSMSFFASTATTTGPAFCPHCGSILDHPDTNNIVCSACEYRCHYEGRKEGGAAFDAE